MLTAKIFESQIIWKTLGARKSKSTPAFVFHMNGEVSITEMLTIQKKESFYANEGRAASNNDV